MRCSGRAVVALATTVTWSAARRSRARRLARLRREFERGNGGETVGSSRRFGGRAERLGGSSGVDRAAMGIHGGRRRRRRRRRLHGTLRLAWLGGELQSEEAELLRVSERRGGDGGYGNGGRWRRQRSVVRESEGEERMGTGESERGAGRRVASFGRSRRRGEKQEVARMRAGGERVPLSSWREEGDDWHGQLGGPACWAAGPGQVSFPLFPSLFLFSNFLTFV